MQHLFVFALVLSLPAAAVITRGSSRVTPVEQVIEMLEDMYSQGTEAKQAEVVQYEEYKQWCDTTISDKTKAISDAGAVIDTAEADIEVGQSSIEKLTEDITELEKTVARLEAESTKASAERATEQADYEALHKDYSESIDALGRAIQTLQAQNPSLMKLQQLQKLPLIPAGAKRSLEVFLAQGRQSPEHGYQFQSQGVVDTLKGLEDKFEEERTAIQSKEATAKSDHDRVMRDLSGQIEDANEESSHKTDEKATTVTKLASDESMLADTSATKKADEEYLGDVNATCLKKETDFGTRDSLREDELAAIDKALTILKGDRVMTGLPSLLSEKRAAFASLRSSFASTSNQERVREFLEQEAQRVHSKVLAELAAKVGADDPFAKVRQMIQDMIVRLQEEASAEASHKSWCDAELATNEKSRTTKSEKVSLLEAEIEGLNASIEILTDEIAALKQNVDDNAKSLDEAKAAREKESAINHATIENATMSQHAVAEAMEILSEFYGEAAKSTALVQEEPEIFDSPYTGMQAENEGVFGLLEVIQSDFARLEAETIKEESAAAEEFKKFTQSTKTDSATKTLDMEHKTMKKQDDEQSRQVAESDLEDTQTQLDEDLAYHETLQGACVSSSVTAGEDDSAYEARADRRAQEIEDLQHALVILEGA